MDTYTKIKRLHKFSDAKGEIPLLLRKAKMDCKKTGILYVQQKVLKFGKVSLAPCSTFVLVSLSSADIQIGLSADKWHQIEARLHAFIEGGIL